MKNKDSEQLTFGTLDPRKPELPAERDFIKVEKNLTSLGFFSPTTKNVKKEAKPKVISYTRIVDGKRLKASVTINPSVMDGLPTTAHQDKTFAFHKLVTDRRRDGEEITNPVGFHSAELLRLLGKRVRTGKNYEEVEEWLNVMTFTGIISEGAVYHASIEEFGKDRYHVFERSVSYGKKLPDGTVADKNYVWLSPWQLENINNNYFLPIDFEAYKQLRNHTAKALVPLLQIWLYASQEQRSFEKSYEDLCQYLNLQAYKYASQIKQKLSPALDELREVGYLASWAIEKMADGKNYKVVFEHGPKFFEDKALRVEQRPGRRRALPRNPRELPAPPPAPTTAEPSEAERLVRSFHQQFYKRGELANPLAAELKKAEELIGKYGFERASQVVPYALRTLKGKSYKPDTFNGIAQYAAAAIEEYDQHREAVRKKQEAAARAKALQSHEDARRAAEEAEFDQTLGQLQRERPEAYRAFLERIGLERRRKIERFPMNLTETARAKLAAEFDTAGKRREIFEQWLPEYEARSTATPEPVEEPESEEDQAEVAAAIAASLGLEQGER